MWYGQTPKHKKGTSGRSPVGHVLYVHAGKYRCLRCRTKVEYTATKYFKKAGDGKPQTLTSLTSGSGHQFDDYVYLGLPLLVCTRCGHYASTLPRHLAAPCLGKMQGRQLQSCKDIAINLKHPTGGYKLTKLPMLSERTRALFPVG